MPVEKVFCFIISVSVGNDRVGKIAKIWIVRALDAFLSVWHRSDTFWNAIGISYFQISNQIKIKQMLLPSSNIKELLYGWGSGQPGKQSNWVLTIGNYSFRLI